METLNPSESATWQALLAQARAGFFERGESIAEWSRRHGFRPNAVYQVLNGQASASRGNAHRIAVALGIKGSGSGLNPPNSGKETAM